MIKPGTIADMTVCGGHCSLLIPEKCGDANDSVDNRPSSRVRQTCIIRPLSGWSVFECCPSCCGC